MHDCPHCAQPLFRKGADKLKARTSILVLHKSGDVEINCARCGKGVLLPLTQAPTLFEESSGLRKAAMPKLVLGKT